MDLGATVALVARLTLAAAFACSAGAKLFQVGAFAASLAAFRVPAPGVVARVVPPAEAALAVALVALPGQAWPAYAAIVLLVVLTGVVVANLAAGQTAPCPCFAPGGNRPVSASTVLRNGVLLGLAVLGTGSVAGAAPGPTVVASAVSATVTVIALRRVG